MKKAFKFCTAILAVMAITVAPASGQMYKSLSVSPITASAADKTAYDWSGMLKKDDSWFNSSDAISVAEDILKYQNSDGGWKKVMEGNASGDWSKSTIDNEGTTSEIRFLARVYKQTGTEKYKNACLKAIDLLLKSQYDNGGWPQCFGLTSGYHIHITYNDDAMIHVLQIMREIASTSGDFTFVDENYANLANKSVEKGIRCILDTQITSQGVKTAWCQQHNEKTLKPDSARAYELPSICTGESVGIVNFLLSVKNPSNEIKESINSAILWMKKSQLDGIKIVEENGDKKVVQDVNASPVWARFYELDTNKPMFVDRDGSKHYDWSEISQERRTGYAWYGSWPNTLAKMNTLPIDDTEKTTAATTTATTTSSLSKIIRGDSNNDGNVDISDVVALRRHLLNKSTYALSDEAIANSDVSGDGNGINAQDAVAIQQFIIGLTDSL